MSESIDDAELGRSKQSTSPRDHLRHLLNIGWDANSPLIVRYVQTHGLRQDLDKLVESLGGKRR